MLRFIVAALAILLASAAQAQSARPMTADDLKVARDTSINFIVCGAYYGGLSSLAEDNGRVDLAMQHVTKFKAFEIFIVGAHYYVNDRPQGDKIKSMMLDLSDRMHLAMRDPQQKKMQDALYSEVCEYLTTIVEKGMAAAGIREAFREAFK
jgi:hypothetical protein